VSKPRAVLAEFGLVVPQEREVHVWDSSAELRYMVMPMPPPGAQDLSEDELASRITREALIGVAEVTLPARAG
jgi:nitrile hydratase